MGSASAPATAADCCGGAAVASIGFQCRSSRDTAATKPTTANAARIGTAIRCVCSGMQKRRSLWHAQVHQMPAEH